jgi:uncharacterized membrane protein YgcG
MKFQSGFVGAWAIAILAGCAPAPLELFSDNKPGDSGPTINQVILHIDCELESAVNSTAYGGLAHVDPIPPAGTNPSNEPLGQLARYEFIGQATLTVDVTDTESLTPSTSFISPYAPIPPSMMSTTNLTLTIGAQLNGTQHRAVTTTLQFDLNKFVENENDATFTQYKKAWPKSECPIVQGTHPNVPFDGTAIKGDLGLTEALEDGLMSIGANGQYGVLQAVVPVNQNGPPNPTTFTSQTDFTVVEGLNGGPNWTLVHFKGPGGGGGGGTGGGASGGSSSGSSMGGGSQGPINFNRQAKDTLLIGFTPRCDSWQPESHTADPGAANYLESLPGCKPGTHNFLLKANPAPLGVLDSVTPSAQNALQNALTNAILQSLSSALH